MTSDNKIINELRKAYDMMLPEQMEEYLDNFETDPISDESKQRIKEMVKAKMQNTGTNKKTGINVRRWVAVAAVFAVVAASVTMFSSKSVRAAVAKLFGFVPGVGIIETEDGEREPYIIDDITAFAEDEKIRVEIKDAFIINDELELRYTLFLTDITDEDLENHLNSVDELYKIRGYDKYFGNQDGINPMIPLSETVFEGRTIESFSETVSPNESLESSRQIGVSQRYKIEEVPYGEEPEGVLTIGDVSVDFKLKKAEMYSSAESAEETGAIAEIDGIKVLCVSKRDGDTLWVDYYVCDIGEYTSCPGFYFAGSNMEAVTEDGTVINGTIDESYLFYSEGSGHIGNRIMFDLSGVSENTDNITVRTSGLLAKKTYENKALTLKKAPEKVQSINEEIDLSGLKLKIEEISLSPFSEEDGYEECKNGYLSVRYMVEDIEGKSFVNFAGVSVNGAEANGYYVNGWDGDYKTMHIPLDVEYEEVRSIEFMGAVFILDETVEFDL